MANGKRIGDLLVELGFITKRQLREALQHQKENAPQKKVGEILMELGFLKEEDLLKCLAGLFKIRYLSSDKLSKMTIPQWILDLIPYEFAEEYCVLPFFCYEKTKIMSVAIPEPQNKQLPKLIRNVLKKLFTLTTKLHGIKQTLTENRILSLIFQTEKTGQTSG